MLKLTMKHPTMICASKLSLEQRELFLEKIERGSALIREAWELYRSITGEERRFPGRPKKIKGEILAKSELSVDEMYELFVTYLKNKNCKQFVITRFCNSLELRREIFGERFPSRDQLREFFELIRNKGFLIPVTIVEPEFKTWNQHKPMTIVGL